MAAPKTDDIAATLALLWGARGQQTRGPRPALSLSAIARAALDIADAEGIEAVSMQRVAAALGVTKMALYRYVDSKADLLAVMIEAAVDDPPDLSTVDGGWRPRLESWAERLRAVWTRHPWLPAATTGARMMGPREVGWTEAAVAALDGSGLTGAERMDTVFLLSGHIRNTHASGGTQPWTVDRRLNPLLTQAVQQPAERFPALVAAAGSPGETTGDNGWAYGLRCILDGVELAATRRAKPSRRPQRRAG